MGGPESGPTTGNILAGADDDTLTHLTPHSAADFAGGINPGTYFVRLGNVSEMTVPEYQANVVGGAAAAGPGQDVRGFVTAAPAAGAFTEAGIFNNAGVMEYMNLNFLSPSAYVPITE